MRIVRSLLCAAALCAGPFVLPACALDATDDSAIAGAKHAELVTRGTDDTTNDATKTPPAPTANPEPSPWKGYTPKLEPEPSPWNGGGHGAASPSGVAQSAAAPNGLAAPGNAIRQVHVDPDGKN